MAMRKPSKTVPRSMYEEERNRATVLSQALQVARSKPEAREVIKLPDYTYILELYRAAGPAGGVVLMTFKCKGQADSVSAYHLEDMHYGYHTPEESAVSCAVGNLRLARDRVARGETLSPTGMLSSPCEEK